MESEPLTDEELAELRDFVQAWSLDREALLMCRLLDEHRALREEVKPWRGYTAQQAVRDQQLRDNAPKLEAKAYEWEVRAVEAEATAARRLELLREVEWSCGIGTCLGDDSLGCAWCKRFESAGHAPDCRLKRELSDAHGP